MKEISPLSNIEKNGLFGNYQNKGEDKLIIINEVTNIKVYQLVKFKSSSLESTSISIDDQICQNLMTFNYKYVQHYGK